MTTSNEVSLMYASQRNNYFYTIHYNIITNISELGSFWRDSSFT